VPLKGPTLRRFRGTACDRLRAGTMNKLHSLEVKQEAVPVRPCDALRMSHRIEFVEKISRLGERSRARNRGDFAARLPPQHARRVVVEGTQTDPLYIEVGFRAAPRTREPAFFDRARLVDPALHVERQALSRGRHRSGRTRFMGSGARGRGEFWARARPDAVCFRPVDLCVKRETLRSRLCTERAISSAEI
jgi:hypothetical protein